MFWCSDTLDCERWCRRGALVRLSTWSRRAGISLDLQRPVDVAAALLSLLRSAHRARCRQAAVVRCCLASVEGRVRRAVLLRRVLLPTHPPGRERVRCTGLEAPVSVSAVER